MAVPKRRKPRSKIKMRKRSHRKPMAASYLCPECGAPAQPHRVCAACGQYKGRQVLTIATED